MIGIFNEYLEWEMGLGDFSLSHDRPWNRSETCGRTGTVIPSPVVQGIIEKSTPFKIHPPLSVTFVYY